VTVSTFQQPGDSADTALAALTPEQRAWVETSERLWSTAHQIGKRHPGVDASDLYHALRCLQLTPSQRLSRALSRGRLRAHAR
jgi:hypothetical protein